MNLPFTITRFSIISLIAYCVYFIYMSNIQHRDNQPLLTEKISLDELLKLFPTQNESRTNYKTYQFNVSVSNTIPLNRNIPDTRPDECKRTGDKDYEIFPKVSIIIPFHNEDWSVLLRSLHSILMRTPDNLLGEIILVDDKSDYSYLKTALQRYCEVLSDKIIITLNRKREGLIRSRISAAKRAKHEILIFLDGHVEVNVGWLPPLLRAIKNNTNTIAVPLIDAIDPNTLEYAAWSYLVHGGMTWTMEFVWKFLPNRLQNRRVTDPIPSPTLLGCAIAIDRNYFFHLGAFDPGMFIWGGENVEISIRSWTCGASILLIPCSRVGHLFREFLPYSFPKDLGGANIMHMNNQRLVDVWLDDYAHIYYAATKPRVTSDEIQLMSRHRLRKRLNCKSFKWFLDNVIPELTTPKPTSKHYGQLINYRGKICMTVPSSSNSKYIKMISCAWHNSSQDFSFNFDNSITYGDGECLTASNKGYVTLTACGSSSFSLRCNQRWSLNLIDGTTAIVQRSRKKVYELFSLTDDCQTAVYLTQVTYQNQQIAGLLPKLNISRGHQLWVMEYTLNPTQTEQL